MTARYMTGGKVMTHVKRITVGPDRDMTSLDGRLALSFGGFATSFPRSRFSVCRHPFSPSTLVSQGLGAYGIYHTMVLDDGRELVTLPILSTNDTTIRSMIHSR
jgi:hypothetical protein